MSMIQETRPYRDGVGIILVNRIGQVFIGQRSDIDQPAWQMPQGGIEVGECPHQAALRELSEEAGTQKVEIVAETAGWITYDLPMNLSYTVWNGLYRGQRQKWYVMRFTGCDADIDVTKGHPPEFSSWRWVKPEMVVSHVVNFKRDLYTRVITELRDVVNDVTRHHDLFCDRSLDRGV